MNFEQDRVREINFLMSLSKEALRNEMYSQYIFLRLLARNFEQGFSLSDAMAKTLPHLQAGNESKSRPS